MYKLTILFLLTKMASLFFVHANHTLKNKDFLPPELLLKFVVNAADFWHFEDITLVDTFSNGDDDYSIAQMLDFLKSNPQMSFKFLSSKSANQSSHKIVNMVSKRAMVTINNDDQEYFNNISFGQLESVTWFVPDSMNISNTRLRLDSNLYLFSKSGNASILLSEAYSVKGGPLIKRQIGSWDHNNGMRIIEPNPWERRRDLEGITINNSILIVNGYPVEVSTRPDNRTIDVVGYFPEMLTLLSQVMNFKVEHIVPADGLYGSRNKDGTWNGMVGMLQRGEADVCTGGLSITLERQDVMDFAMPLMEESITFMLMNPSGKGTVNVWAYLETFTITSWIVIFITLVVFTLVLVIFGRCTKITFSDTDQLSFAVSIGFMFMTILQRDHHLLCTWHSTRVISLVASMFCYLIFTYFSTVLTSFMTVLEPAVQIHSFYDILKYDYHMVTLKGSSIETFLQGTKQPSVFYDIYTKDMKNRPDAFLLSFGDIVKSIQDDPKTGLFGPSSMIYSMDGLVELKLPEALSSYSAIGLQKNSEFTKMFDYHLLKMSQSGVMFRVYDKWANATSYGARQDDEVIVLGYDNVIFPCLILVVGIALALVLVLAENCFGLAKRNIPVL